MEKTILIHNELQDINACLSFRPVIDFLRKKQSNQEESSIEMYNDLLEEISLHSKLNEPITDPALISRHYGLIERMMNAILPEAHHDTDFYAVCAPFSTEAFFSSAGYESYFINAKPGPYIEEKTSDNLSEAFLRMASQLIQQNYSGLSSLHPYAFVHPVTDPVSGLVRMMEVELLTEFVQVALNDKLAEVPAAIASQNFTNTSGNELLLNDVTFEGVMIIKVRDVTMRDAITKINNLLVSMPCFGDAETFEKLQKQVQCLVGSPEILISITALTTMNRNCIYPVLTEQQDFLLQPVSTLENTSTIWLRLMEMFEERPYLEISVLTDAHFFQFPFLQPGADGGIKSLLMLPLKSDEELLGVLSIVSKTPGMLKPQHLLKIEPVVPLLVLALSNQSEKPDDEVDRVIKEQFTAVQSSVNWKFTEAARNFILQKNNGGETKIDSIVFENVFPLYGSIDVRNSSVERSIAMHKDLREQLHLAEAIIRKSKGEMRLFSLQEVSYRLEKYINIASVVLFPGDEMEIQNFLDTEITEIFNHLKIAVPEMQSEIDHYFLLLNVNTRKISTQCTAFEESIAMINNELVKFINQEQIKVQEIYAHYFEYFVTDGIDFNIYIGQSITPDKPFDHFYLKNLKLWQLATLVKAAQKVRKLQDNIPVPLDTTQLILAHNKPLSISFRAAERKFDVDGAYNIHYEIIKKRIDKIKILGSCERLTQPGKIAIVFAHNKEALEYEAYIDFLQNEGMLQGDIEYYDLEELPGVRGLKALRVTINMEMKEEACPLMISNYHLPVAG